MVRGCDSRTVGNPKVLRGEEYLELNYFHFPKNTTLSFRSVLGFARHVALRVPIKRESSRPNIELG